MGQHQLGFDEVGQVALVCESEDSQEPVIQVVAEHLQRKAFVDAQGKHWLLDASADKPRPALLGGEAARFRIMTVSVGAQASQVDLQAAVFVWGTYYGQRTRWNLHLLYGVLGLRSYQGHRWTWVAKNTNLWSKAFLKLRPHNLNCITKAQGASSNALPAAGDEERHLAWPSIDTAGLLLPPGARPRARLDARLCRLAPSSLRPSRWLVVPTLLADRSTIGGTSLEGGRS